MAEVGDSYTSQQLLHQHLLHQSSGTSMTSSSTEQRIGFRPVPSRKQNSTAPVSPRSSSMTHATPAPQLAQHRHYIWLSHTELMSRHRLHCTPAVIQCKHANNAHILPSAARMPHVSIVHAWGVITMLDNIKHASHCAICQVQRALPLSLTPSPHILG